MSSYTIGELSRRTGVPVKTIRYYHEEGVLKPSGTTQAGYRLYTDADEERLTAIRSFRGLGFSLGALQTILDNPQDARMTAQLQLHLLRTQLRVLRRQEAIVESALDLESEEDIRERLELASVAASLAAEERQAEMDVFLDRFNRSKPDETAKIRRMALLDIPDELEPDQLRAWVELSALLRDESFTQLLHEQHAPFKDANASQEAIGSIMQDVTARMRSLSEQGAAPTDPRVQQQVERWTSAFARALHREPDAAFLRWFLTYSERTNDVRIERFWQLVSRLHRRCAPSFYAGLTLLIEGLRARLAA